MRILQIVHTIDSEIDGLARSVRGLHAALNKINHIQSFIACNYFENYFREIKNLKKYKYFKFFGKKISYELLFKMNKIAADFDVIHIHGLWNDINIFFLLFYYIKKRPKIIYSIHGALSEEAFYSSNFIKKILWIIQKKSIEMADIIHVTSFKEFNEVRKHGFKNKIITIPWGVDILLNRDEILPPSKKNKEILYLARINEIKGIELLIEAWGLVGRDCSWRLNIVGDGKPEYVLKIQNKISTLGLKNISFSGPLFGSDKIEIFKKSYLYILPSKSENFGLTVIEAMGCGCPVLVSNRTPWLHIHNTCGWVFNLSAIDLADSIYKIINLSNGEIQKIIDRAYLSVVSDYQWEDVANKFLLEYESIISD